MIYSQAFLSALRPPDPLPCWQWVEGHVRMDSRTGPASGMASTETMPYLREVLEAIADDSVETIALLASVQSLKTTVVLWALMRQLSEDPGSLIYVCQSKDEATIFSRDRLYPYLELTDTIALKKSRRGSTNLYDISLPQCPVYIIWGGSEARAQSKPARYIILDECELYPDVALDAEKRASVFFNSRIVYLSTPKKVNGIIDRKFREGSQHTWHFRCRKCGTEQPLVWTGKRKDGSNYGICWDKTAKHEDGWHFAELDPWYECVNCPERYPDTPANRRYLASQGRWIALNPNYQTKPRKKLSFCWNALLPPNPPGLAWQKLAEEYIRAKQLRRAGSDIGLVDFWTKRMGQPFGLHLVDADDSEIVLKSVSPDRPFTEVVRILSADIQKPSGESDFLIYWVCCGWDREGSCKVIEAGRCLGFDALKKVQERLEVKSWRVFLDSGFKAPVTYEQCVKNQWQCTKGEFVAGDGFYTVLDKEGKQRRTYSHRAKDDPFANERARGIKCGWLWVWSTQATTDVLVKLMSGTLGDRSFILPPNIPEDFLKHIHGTSQKPVEDRHGNVSLKWEDVDENHYLDALRLNLLAVIQDPAIAICKVIEAPKEVKAAA